MKFLQSKFDIIELDRYYDKLEEKDLRDIYKQTFNTVDTIFCKQCDGDGAEW